MNVQSVSPPSLPIAESAIEEPISAALIGRAISPYMEHCRYLREGAVALHKDGKFGIRAHFRIPESCYIASTGHFNAVEFNICFNQLAYVLVGHLIGQARIAPLSHWTLDHYWRKQLASCFIARFQSEFRGVIQADAFRGTMWLDKIFMRKGTLFLDASVRFEDSGSGKARGGVLLAIVNANEGPR